MPAEIHKQVLDYQGGDANAALELVEKFKPLIKRYAFFLHREDSFEDLQRFLLSMLKTWDTSRLSSTDDATVTRYIANSVKNEYIALSKQKAKERGTSYLEDATLPQALEYAQKTSTCDQYDQLTLQDLHPNHQFYGEDASTPVLLPEDAIVALRETGLWELHADQISLDSCPVNETWPFGENQLEFPLELEAGQSQTGNIYIPGGTDMTTGLPMAPYTLDVRTSMGDFSYYGMAIAPSGNGWGTYKTSAGRIENIQAAEHLARFLEDSQLLLWLAPSTFVAMESKSTLAADDTIYHAVSATILYLTAQGKIQPLVYQSGIPYYSQEVFEKVLLEMFGQHLDCTGLLQPVQIETHEEEAIPIKYPLAGAAYRVTLLSQQDSSSLYAGTPESAAAPSSEATVSLTYYLPSSAQVGEILFMPGERPYRISVQSNVSWEYLPFCFLGIEQET